MAYHPVFVRRPARAKLDKDLLRALAQAFIIEVVGVNHTGFDACLRGMEARRQPLVERTGCHGQGMQPTQCVGQHGQHLLRWQIH